jgi:hypothetical protein
MVPMTIFLSYTLLSPYPWLDYPTLEQGFHILFQPVGAGKELLE